MSGVQRIDNAVLVDGRHARLLWLLVRREIKRIINEPDASRPTDELRALGRALQPVADEWEISVRGNSEAVPSETSAQWAHDHEPDEIDTTEAAEIIGRSVRRVVQLLNSQQLAGRKRGGVWTVDRTSALAYAEDRDT